LLGADPRLPVRDPIPGGELRTAVQSLEREMIRRGLVQTQSNKTKLADQLGVSRTTLIKKIKEYGIDDSE
jgi:two-component system, NtrC family, response regulator HupR/HoxA